LTTEEAADLVLLRRHYGISARDAYLTIPEWEITLLLAALPEREAMLEALTEDDADGDVPDPWESPPQELLDLLD